MDEKISLEAISLYGDSFSEKITKNFFTGKDQITGQEILSLTGIQQVNLFIIRELFKSWKEEARKQKSAYFDNEHPEVKEALTNYMSVVSNHILIDQHHFTPLLKKAVSQTLLLIFNPYDFFSLLISGKNSKLELLPFREEIKYLKINKAPLERMMQKLEEQGTKEIAGNEAFAVLDHILEEVNFTPEDVDGYIRQFSEVLPLNPETFYVPRIESKNKEVPREVREKQADFHATKVSLNEQLVTGQKPLLMDNLKKISKIKDNLSINQKFMFTKVLFYNDFDSFSRAIDEIDQLQDLPSALSYLDKYSSGWDRDSNEFHEFMEMVEKRFN